jgi:hypothetical protein
MKCAAIAIQLRHVDLRLTREGGWSILAEKTKLKSEISDKEGPGVAGFSLSLYKAATQEG